jgi:uncharacterized protein involved in outer membrane biogenesis
MAFLRKILIAILVLLSLMAVLGILIVWQYGPRVKEFVRTSIHENITTEVSFSEEMDVSLWREFPRLAVGLRDVTVLDAFKKDTLLRADRVSVQLDIIKVLTDRLVIEGISVSDGFIRLRQNGKGDWNYVVWRKGDDSESATDLSIDLLALSGMTVDFDSKKSGLSFLLFSEKSKLNGRFTDDDQRIGASIRGIMHRLTTSDVLRVNELPLDLKAVLHIRDGGKTIGVETGNAVLAGNEFIWSMLLRDGGEHLQLSLQGKGIEPDRLLPHIWPDMPQPVRSLGIRGRSDITLSLDGPLSGKSGPSLHATWAMRDGGITFRELPVKGVHFSADISLPDLARPQDATFVFAHFKLTTPSGRGER